ncbi:MAG: glycosyltransferase family 2 protein [Candidatus Aminicenantales bacterium]
MSEWPRISIVTPSYNQGQFLEETIGSVLDQGYQNLEYIVIDGGSTDNSVDIIKRYAGRLAYWVSEKDRGQSHALNKGFSRATGDILAWINSDDLFIPGSLQTVARAWQQNKGRVIAGDVIWFYDDSRKETIWVSKGLTFENLIKYWTGDCVYQQPGTFFPLRLCKEVGGIDESLNYAMDYDLFCRLFRQTSAVYVNEPLARFRYHAHSKSATGAELSFLEKHSVSRRYWDIVSPDEKRDANRYMARYLSRQSMHRLKSGNLLHSIRLYRAALGFDLGSALAEPGLALISRRRNR